MTQNDKEWDRGDRSTLISIGNHSLYLQVSRRDRIHNEPIVVLMTGSGSNIDEWVAVRRLVEPFARFLWYDRSGLGRSDTPPILPDAISATSIAADLDSLLKTASVKPPYVILCHSRGGITAREFLHLRPDHVAGIVFVDANQEDTFHHEKGFPGESSPCFEIMMTGIDYFEVTDIKANTVLSKEEFQAVLNVQARPLSKTITSAEEACAKLDPPVLEAKKQPML